MRVDTLLRDRLGDALRVAALELSSEEVAEPTLEQRDDTAQEEEPDTPAGRPETDTGTLADRTRVEARVDLGDVAGQHGPSAAEGRRKRYSRRASSPCTCGSGA